MPPKPIKDRLVIAAASTGAEEVASGRAGATCGGCGYAGCADYAKAVVMDGVPCDKCAPGGPKAAAAIAKIMGGEASAVEKKAVVQCQGSSEHCKPATPSTMWMASNLQTLVQSPRPMQAKEQVLGPPYRVNQDKGAVANKLCTTSCIACGMCERTCKFDAIHVVDGVARVECSFVPYGSSFLFSFSVCAHHKRVVSCFIIARCAFYATGVSAKGSPRGRAFCALSIHFITFFFSGICAISSGVVVSLLQEQYGFAYGMTGTLLSAAGCWASSPACRAASQ